MVPASEAVKFVAAHGIASEADAEKLLESVVNENGGRRMRTSIVPITPRQVLAYLKDRKGRGTDSYRVPASFFTAGGHQPPNDPQVDLHHRPE